MPLAFDFAAIGDPIGKKSKAKQNEMRLKFKKYHVLGLFNSVKKFSKGKAVNFSLVTCTNSTMPSSITEMFASFLA